MKQIIASLFGPPETIRYTTSRYTASRYGIGRAVHICDNERDRIRTWAGEGEQGMILISFRGIAGDIYIDYPRKSPSIWFQWIADSYYLRGGILSVGGYKCTTAGPKIKTPKNRKIIRQFENRQDILLMHDNYLGLEKMASSLCLPCRPEWSVKTEREIPPST